MTNVKITNLWYGRRVNHLMVIADTRRFGPNEILYEGTLQGCLNYIHRHGIRNYKASF